MEFVGEEYSTTARGKPILLVTWRRPCSVCGEPYEIRIPKLAPTDGVEKYSSTCFKHSEEKRKRKATRRRRRAPHLMKLWPDEPRRTAR